MSQFPDDAILWRGWNDATLSYLREKNRPVLLFVADSHPMIAPFLMALFRAMPAHPKLRSQLREHFPALFIKSDELPEYLRDLGAGSSYHVAILSPNGFTPIATIDPMSGSTPDEIADSISLVLERLQEIWC